MARPNAYTSYAVVFGTLGIVFLAIGMANTNPGLWAPGVAFLAIGGACAWQARRRRAA